MSISFPAALAAEQHRWAGTHGRIRSFPTLTVLWDEKRFGLTVPECAQQLRDGTPRIEVLTGTNPSQVLARVSKDPSKAVASPSVRGHADPHLQIISITLQPGEDLIVGSRLRQILNKARRQAS